MCECAYVYCIHMRARVYVCVCVCVCVCVLCVSMRVCEPTRMCCVKKHTNEEWRTEVLSINHASFLNNTSNLLENMKMNERWNMALMGMSIYKLNILFPQFILLKN